MAIKRAELSRPFLRTTKQSLRDNKITGAEAQKLEQKGWQAASKRKAAPDAAMAYAKLMSGFEPLAADAAAREKLSLMTQVVAAGPDAANALIRAKVLVNELQDFSTKKRHAKELTREPLSAVFWVGSKAPTLRESSLSNGKPVVEFRYRSDKPLDAGTLEKAIAQMLNEHPALRRNMKDVVIAAVNDAP